MDVDLPCLATETAGDVIFNALFTPRNKSGFQIKLAAETGVKGEMVWAPLQCVISITDRRFRALDV